MDKINYNTVFAAKTKQLAITIIRELSRIPYDEAFSVIKTNLPLVHLNGCKLQSDVQSKIKGRKVFKIMHCY